MGQGVSQLPEEEDFDSKDETLKHEQHKNNDSIIDDFTFSSQIQSSIYPILPPPRHPTKIKYSGSSPPTAHLFSSQAPSPVASHKMADSSPCQHSPAIRSSIDFDDQIDQHGNIPQKKKKRNKKGSSLTSHPDDSDRRPFIPHSSIDPSATGYTNQQNGHDYDPANEVNGGDADMINGGMPGSAQVQSEFRDQLKKDKKESRRAAKLARQQQAVANSASEAIEEPSRFAELWDAQERAVAAKREHVEEDDANPPLEEPAPKKRKRKSQQNEEALPHSSKKHKHSSSGTSGIASEGHVRQSQNHNDINLIDLAEELYSSRKKRSRHDRIQTEANTEAGEAHDHAAEVIDIDDPVRSHLIGNGQVEIEANNEAEMYRDDIDQDYRDNRGADDMAFVDPALVDPALVDQALQTGHFINGTGHGHEYAEVPSSIPHPNRVDEVSAKRRATSKTSTGRKRVAKPDFFSRVTEEGDDNNNSQSPSTAALSRKKGKGKQIAVPDNETQAGPSTINGTPGQPTVTRMLRDSASADGDTAVTPASKKLTRARTPKTPATTNGVFSEFELRNLNQAIDRFKNDHNMSQHEVNDLIHSNPKVARAGELWEIIMASCPGRSRQKTINQTRRRFHNFVARGTWTPEQEQELKQMYEQYGNKYSLIGQFINRHPEDIRDRIRNYIVCGDKQRKDQWSREETQQLIAIVEQAIAEISSQRAQRNMDNSRPVEEDINWQLVSEGMDRTRSRLQCMSKWKAIKPLIAGGGLDGELIPIEEIIQKARETATTMSYRNRFHVIKAVLKSGANADSRIPWLKVRTDLGLQWTRPPLMVVWYRLRRSLPNWQSLNVKEVCTLLIQEFQQSHKLEYPGEENSDLDYDGEYREIQHKIKRGRKSNPGVSSSAIVTNDDDDDQGEHREEEEEEEEEEKAIQSQLDATGEEAAEEAEMSQRTHRSSVDLGVGSIGENEGENEGKHEDENEPEVEDSEPDAKARIAHRRRNTRSRGHQTEVQESRYDESSDTNASQVSSIPAR